MFNNWLWKRRQYVLPDPVFAIYDTSGLLCLPESEIRAGKLLGDPGHLQKRVCRGVAPTITTEELAAVVLG